MAITLKLRRDTIENWVAYNPVLAVGELGLEISSNENATPSCVVGRFKFGNGINHWNELEYASTGTEAFGDISMLSSEVVELSGYSYEAIPSLSSTVLNVASGFSDVLTAITETSSALDEYKTYTDFDISSLKTIESQLVSAVGTLGEESDEHKQRIDKNSDDIVTLYSDYDYMLDRVNNQFDNQFEYAKFLSVALSGLSYEEPDPVPAQFENPLYGFSFNLDEYIPQQARIKDDFVTYGAARELSEHLNLQSITLCLSDDETLPWFDGEAEPGLPYTELKVCLVYYKNHDGVFVEVDRSLNHHKLSTPGATYKFDTPSLIFDGSETIYVKYQRIDAREPVSPPFKLVENSSEMGGCGSIVEPAGFTTNIEILPKIEFVFDAVNNAITHIKGEVSSLSAKVDGLSGVYYPLSSGNLLSSRQNTISSNLNTVSSLGVQTSLSAQGLRADVNTLSSRQTTISSDVSSLKNTVNRLPSDYVFKYNQTSSNIIPQDNPIEFKPASATSNPIIRIGVSPGDGAIVSGHTLDIHSEYISYNRYDEGGEIKYAFSPSLGNNVITRMGDLEPYMKKEDYELSSKELVHKTDAYTRDTINIYPTSGYAITRTDGMQLKLSPVYFEDSHYIDFEIPVKNISALNAVSSNQLSSMVFDMRVKEYENPVNDYSIFLARTISGLTLGWTRVSGYQQNLIFSAAGTIQVFNDDDILKFRYCKNPGYAYSGTFVYVKDAFGNETEIVSSSGLIFQACSSIELAIGRSISAEGYTIPLNLTEDFVFGNVSACIEGQPTQTVYACADHMNSGLAMLKSIEMNSNGYVIYKSDPYSVNLFNFKGDSPDGNTIVRKRDITNLSQTTIRVWDDD